MNMTKCHQNRGLTEYFLYKGVASGEEVTHTIYICRARTGATKTRSNGMKVEYFLSTINRTNYFTKGGAGLCMTHNKGKNLSDRSKKELKDIRDS